LRGFWFSGGNPENRKASHKASHTPFLNPGKAALQSATRPDTITPQNKLSGSGATALRRAGRCYSTARPTANAGNRRRHEKEKRPFKPLTEAEERKAWEEIKDLEAAGKAAKEFGLEVGADTTLTREIPTARRKFAAVSLTRDEAEAWLQEQGLSKSERALVLGHIDGLSTRELEAATGWKKSRIAQKLKNLTILEAIANLRSGRARPGKLPTQRAPVAEAYRSTIPVVLARLKAYFHDFPYQVKPMGWPVDPAQGIERNAALPVGVTIQMIRECPDILLDKEIGRHCVATLTELLYAARYGATSGRGGDLFPKASRRTVRKKAYNLLSYLIRREPRGRFPWAENSMAEMTAALVRRFELLKTEWDATFLDEIPERLERLRARHPFELRKFKDEPLKALLRQNPLRAACSLAGKVSGVDAKTFQAAYRKHCPHPTGF